MRVLLLLVIALALCGPAWARDERSLRDAPEFAVTVEPLDVPQGGVLWIRVRSLDTAPVKDVAARLGDARAHGVPWSGGEVMALIPVDILHHLGPARLMLRVVDAWNRVHDVEVPVVVRAGDFETDELGVSRSFTEPSRQQRAWANDDARALDAAWKRASTERRWRGPFQRPMDSVTTARFGTFRTINGRTRSRHMGLDLRGKRGDPIHSTNDGTVLLARACFYSGNTVVVDHGGGVQSVYFHMTTMAVKTGERVRKGQLLGVVGNTGRVTGPHLHFGVKLSRIYVDPEALFALDLGGDPRLLPPKRDQSPIREGN